MVRLGRAERAEDVRVGNPIEDYCRLYGTFAKAAKSAFPGLEVGGPTTGIGGALAPWQEKFVAYCRENAVPLDFFSFTFYHVLPTSFASLVGDIRRLLDRNGFQKTKIVCSEWHLEPRDWDALKGAWGPERSRLERVELTGPNAAAYAAGVLSHLQTAPVDELCYYSATVDVWGLVDGLERRLTWYAFKAFATLAAKGEATRIDAPSNVGDTTYLLASKRDGRGYLLVTSLFQMKPVAVIVRQAFRPVRIRAIDAAHRLEDLEPSHWGWNSKSGRLTLYPSAGGSSTVWLVEFDLTATSEAPEAESAKPVRQEINGN